jgi:hypothetical protein
MANVSVRRNALIRIRNFKWTKQNVKAAHLVAANELTHKKIAAEVGVSPRALANWLEVPTYRSFISRLIESTRKQLAQRYVAQQDQRISSYISDFERTDALIKARAADPEMCAAPGGNTGLLTRDVKSIGSGENAEIVDVYEFDAALMRERRELRKAVAEELGQIVQKHEVKSMADIPPERWTPEQLDRLAEHIIHRETGIDDPQQLAEAKKQLALETTAEVVEPKNSIPE